MELATIANVNFNNRVKDANSVGDDRCNYTWQVTCYCTSVLGMAWRPPAPRIHWIAFQWRQGDITVSVPVTMLF